LNWRKLRTRGFNPLLGHPEPHGANVKKNGKATDSKTTQAEGKEGRQ